MLINVATCYIQGWKMFFMHQIIKIVIKYNIISMLIHTHYRKAKKRRQKKPTYQI